MVTGALETQIFGLKKNVCYFIALWLRLSSQRSFDHIQWSQWLEVVIHHRYVTLVWCHMDWSSQKCLEVMIISTNVMHNFSVRPLYIYNASQAYITIERHNVSQVYILYLSPFFHTWFLVSVQYFQVRIKGKQRDKIEIKHWYIAAYNWYVYNVSFIWHWQLTCEKLKVQF